MIAFHLPDGVFTRVAIGVSRGVRLYLVCARCTRTVPEIVPEQQCTIQHSIFYQPRPILEFCLFISFCWVYFSIMLVPGGGVEPPCPEGRRILSPLRYFRKRPVFFLYKDLRNILG